MRSMTSPKFMVLQGEFKNLFNNFHSDNTLDKAVCIIQIYNVKN